MPQIIACPACRQKLRIADPRPGYSLQVRCTKCAAEFEWPEKTENFPVVRRNGESLPSAPWKATKTALTSLEKKVASLTLPDWFKAPHGFGKMVPRMDTTPKVAELYLLDMVCSHTCRKYTQTFVRTRLGEPFRLVDNGDAGTYLQLARQNGCHISEGIPGTASWDEFDWSNWQCAECGHGVIAGDRNDFFYCEGCNSLNCASSVVYPRGAQMTAICGGCHRSILLMLEMENLPATKHVSHRR